MKILSSKLVAVRAQPGLSNGNFYPDNMNIITLIEESNQVNNKKRRQDKKRVERPMGAPEFYQFVQEVYHFADTIASCDNILRLVNDIDRNSYEENVPITGMELNWKSSSLSFTRKIPSSYACYEDITSPFLAALGMIQNGIRTYSHSKITSGMSQSTTSLSKVQGYLLQYPNTSLYHGVSNTTISDAFDLDTSIAAISDSERFQMEKLGKRSKFSFLLASISHLVLLK